MAFYFFAALFFVLFFFFDALFFAAFFFGAAFFAFFGPEDLDAAFFGWAFFAAFFTAACGEAAICGYGGTCICVCGGRGMGWCIGKARRRSAISSSGSGEKESR